MRNKTASAMLLYFAIFFFVCSVILIAIASAGETRSPEYWVGYRAGQYDTEKKHRTHDRELQKEIEKQAAARVKAIGDCVVKLERCKCPQAIALID